MRTSVFTIDGKPKAKARPRMCRNGHAYTPKETVEYEKKVREAYIEQHGINFEDKSVEMYVTFIFPVPKSWSKKKKQDAIDGKLKMMSKPDLDNLVKSVADSLNSVAYNDDSQIINLVADKRYGEKGMTMVWLKESVPSAAK